MNGKGKDPFTFCFSLKRALKASTVIPGHSLTKLTPPVSENFNHE